MGLAASQARLLSITSRLSDNELRTQLINNSKMRLATESSRVSEDYINALNSATMMMTNYDVNGNETTQALTFNTLTAYSPSNNQYGLVDTNGRILVSATEANKFEQSGGNLDKFLEQHGLKYTTSYFKGSTFGDWFDPAVAPNGVVNLQMENADGEMVTYASYSPEELKAMYLGGSVMVDGMAKTYPSYEATQMSSEYYNYLEKYAKFDEEVSEYVDYYWDTFAKGLNNKLKATTFDASGITNYNTALSGGSLANNDPDAGVATAVRKYLNALTTGVDELIPSNSNYDQIIGSELVNMGYSVEGNHVYRTLDPNEELIPVVFRDFNGGDRLRVLGIGPKVYKIEDDGTFALDEDDERILEPVLYQGENQSMLGPKTSGTGYQIYITDWAGTPGFNVNVYGIDKGVYISSGVTTSSLMTLGTSGTKAFTSSDSYPTDLKTASGLPIVITSINNSTGVATIKITNSEENEEIDEDETGSTIDAYLKLDKTYDTENEIYRYNITNHNIYADSSCSTQADYGNQTWDHDTGTLGIEKYNSDHWSNLQTFKYTNAEGELFVVTLEATKTDVNGNIIAGRIDDKNSTVKQTVKKAVLGDELASIVEKLEERVRLEIIEEQELFNIEDAKTILLNCIKTPTDANDDGKIDAAEQAVANAAAVNAEREMDAYYAALQETVYQYLDSLFGGREVDQDGNMVFKDVDENGNSLYQKLYEELWQSADKIGDIRWVMGFVEDHHAYTSIIEENETYNAIKSIGVLEQLFDTFGEPKMGWVDTSDNNSDGTKKAEWYTNLFNKMLDGYKVLEQGLTGSKDWIQYALESGLATVVQVDKARNWTGAGYKNIKEITEVVDEKAVAVAEAQYNKAMNDIENKDKRFDMELKNIDAEHSALQQEYETIKSVISKNVERTFKYYS